MSISAAGPSVDNPDKQPAGDDRNVHLTQWLDARRLLTLIATATLGLLVLATIGLLYFTQVAFFPIVLAILLKLVFSPVVRQLRRLRVPYFAGSMLVVGAIFVAMASAMLFLSGPATTWLEDAPEHFSELESKLQVLKGPIEKFNDVGERLSSLTDVDGKSPPISVQVQQPIMAAGFLELTGDIAVGAFLTLVILFFLLAGGDRFLEKVLQLTPAWQNRRQVVELARDIQLSVSSFLFATTCINIGLGIAIGLAMWVIGLPNPVLWGVMAGCLNFLPYFGCIVGTGIVFLVGVISLDTLGQAAWAPVAYLVLNGVEGYFITPSILGRSISLSPLAIIISLILWGWLWGVGGMLIAVPLLAATKIACDHIEPLKPCGQFLGR